MAKSMTKLFAMWLFIIAAAAPLAVGAESLPDPTRPLGGTGEAVVLSAQTGYPPVRGLQSVIISPARCAAIIDGKTVVLGSRHGSETLVEVNERGVVLQAGNGRSRVLALFPGVGMKSTEAVQTAKQPIACNTEQMKNARNPASLAGSKEKK